MVLGGIALWVGVPAAILWGLGQIADTKAEHYIYALLAVPSAMLLFALLLTRVNAVYLRLSRGPHTGEGGDDAPPRLRGPLDRILAICALIALVVVLGYLLFGGENLDGGTVG